MSSNPPESSNAELNRSTSIRNYLESPKSAQITSVKTIPKPLSSTEDNVQLIPLKKKTPLTTPTTPTKKINTKSEKTRSFIDLITSKKTQLKATSTSEQSSLKRSHSAISSLDNVNKTWLNEPIKLRRRNYQEETYDRLTPKIIDMPSAQFIMTSSKPITFDSKPEEGEESYELQVAKACGIETSRRILNYTEITPASKAIDLRKSTSKPKLLTRTSTTSPRHILSSPVKMLDAPYMEDDYYLNLLDWSSLNVVAIALNRSIYLWSTDTGSVQPLNYESNDLVTSVNWSNDGTFLAIGTSSGDTQIWDVESNTKTRSMEGQDSRVNVLSWDKHVVSSGGNDGSIWHHDVRMAQHKIRDVYGHADTVCGLKWRWDGQLLASGGNDNTVNIWDARSATPRFTKTNHIGAVKALAWCPWQHNTLATGGGQDDKKIHFWDASSGTRRHTIETSGQVSSLHWSKHYKEIVSTHGSPNNQITVWEYPSLNKVIDIPAHESRILHSVLSPDGETLATAAADDNLKFWKIFDSHGNRPLVTASGRLLEQKESKLRRSRSIR